MLQGRWALSANRYALKPPPQPAIDIVSITPSAPHLLRSRRRSLALASVAALACGFALAAAAGARLDAMIGAALGATALVIGIRAARGLLETPAPASPVDDSDVLRSHSLVERMPDGVIVVDPDSTIRWMSPAASRLLGAAPSSLASAKLVSQLHEEDGPLALSAIADAIEHGRTSSPAKWRVRAPDGSERVVESLAVNLLKDPDVRGVTLHMRDVSKRHLTPAPVVVPGDSLRDPLTGLASRALFRDRVAHAITRAQRQQTRVAVMLLDVDNFRSINDAFGSPAGDRLLTDIARRLGTCLRSSDTASRFGNDEFGVLLEEMKGDGDVEPISRRIEEALAFPFPMKGRELLITTSIGIARAGADSADDLLHNADLALAVAKRHGRGASMLFEPGMHAAAVERLELEADLRRAVEANEFTLHYQPIVILHNRRIAGVEALVRWMHPTRGLVAPDTFLPLAEETGLIVPLGRWVLVEACTQAKTWQEELGPERPFTVTVNVSAAQLAHPTFVDDVSRALRSSRIDPHRLVLEIADSVIMKNSEAAFPRLQALKALGVRIAIDDFGSKNSSLHHLPGFPIDILKIDKSFIDRIGKSAEEATFAQVIVALGKSMRLRTVAEGIEDETQVAELLRCKCEFGQGSLFSKPLPAAALLALLRRGG